MCYGGKITHSLLVTVLFVFCSTPTVNANPILQFNVLDSTPLVGDTITVDVEIIDVNDLFAFNLDIGFDSALLNVVTVDPGPFLAGGGLTLGALGLFAFDASTSGTIQNISDSLLGPVPGVSGSGVLATITFDTLSAGVSSLAFLNVNALAGTELVDSIGLPIAITSAPGTDITVTAVPEPKSILLIISGLWILFLKRSRYQQRLVF